jgi:hypothetical protein
MQVDVCLMYGLRNDELAPAAAGPSRFLGPGAYFSFGEVHTSQKTRGYAPDFELSL